MRWPGCVAQRILTGPVRRTPRWRPTTTTAVSWSCWRRGRAPMDQSPAVPASCPHWRGDWAFWGVVEVFFWMRVKGGFGGVQ